MWPIQDLLRLVDPEADKALARRLGCSNVTLERWREVGLSDDMADKLAVRLGLHPGTVWPDWFDVALSVVDRQFVESGWRRSWEHAENHTDVVWASDYPTPATNPAQSDLGGNDGTLAVVA